MKDYKSFIFQGGWRLFLEGLKEEMGEEYAKELLWNLMTYCTNEEFTSDSIATQKIVRGIAMDPIRRPIKWREAAVNLSRTAFIVYLLLQEEERGMVTPTRIEQYGFMAKGTASKAIKELKEKGYIE